MSPVTIQSVNLSFDQFSDFCLRYQCFQSPSLFHGVLTAQLCTSNQSLRPYWVALFTQLLGLDHTVLSEEDQQLVLAWLDATQDQLSNSHYDFMPLLPDEIYELEARFEALIRWVQGFSKAFRAADIPPQRLSQEAQEGLEDLQRLMTLANTPLLDSEDNEKDMLQWVEFVRLLALMLYTELNPAQPRVMNS